MSDRRFSADRTGAAAAIGWAAAAPVLTSLQLGNVVQRVRLGVRVVELLKQAPDLVSQLVGCRSARTLGRRCGRGGGGRLQSRDVLPPAVESIYIQSCPFATTLSDTFKRSVWLVSTICSRCRVPLRGTRSPV
jgi:hypothetical protein